MCMSCGCIPVGQRSQVTATIIDTSMKNTEKSKAERLQSYIAYCTFLGVTIFLLACGRFQDKGCYQNRLPEFHVQGRLGLAVEGFARNQN